MLNFLVLKNSNNIDDQFHLSISKDKRFMKSNIGMHMGKEWLPYGGNIITTTLLNFN